MPFITPPLPLSARSALSVSTFLPSLATSPCPPSARPLPDHPHPPSQSPTSPPPVHSPPSCRQRNPPPPREYRTHSANNTHPDNAHLLATVVSVLPVDIAEQHFQITLDVSAIGLQASHKSPGQFVQLARDVVDGRFFRWSKRKTSFLTIASAPGACHFEFLVAAASDPLKLATCREGDAVSISPVMGSGINCLSMVQGSANLHVFADAPQGFAMTKSLIEWPDFRAASGEGANRVNHLTVYYSVPSGRALPYAHCFSQWSVFGVNVVPLAGLSVMEFLGAQSSLGRKAVVGDYAIACVATEDTFESLHSALVMFGVPGENVRKFTQQVVEREMGARKEEEHVPREHNGQGNSSEFPKDAREEKKRGNVEQEVWRSWVNVRESMREDFERKWASQERLGRDAKRSEDEKKEAWTAWCAQNREQWDQVKWDNEQWGKYWSSWGESTESRWSSGRNWAAGGVGGGYGAYEGRHQNQRRQQNSTEYWDWVGRGTKGKKESWDGFSNGSAGSWDTGGNYHNGYAGSQSGGGTSNEGSKWGGYQKGGYNYGYGESRQDRRNRGAYSGTNESWWGRGAGQSWSGWNRNTSGRRSWAGNGTGGRFEDIDFYAVLGIDSRASHADIKKAYRKQAMQHHPDRNPERAEEAHKKMKQIVVAWSVLKDDDKRRRYDTYGPAGL